MINKNSYKFRKENEKDMEIRFYNTPIGTIHIGHVREAWHKTKKEFYGKINYRNTESKLVYGNSIEEVENKIINEMDSKAQPKSELERYLSMAKDKGLKEANQNYRLESGSRKILAHPSIHKTPQLKLERNK